MPYLVSGGQSGADAAHLRTARPAGGMDEAWLRRGETAVYSAGVALPADLPPSAVFDKRAGRRLMPAVAAIDLALAGRIAGISHRAALNKEAILRLAGIDYPGHHRDP